MVVKLLIQHPKKSTKQELNRINNTKEFSVYFIMNFLINIKNCLKEIKETLRETIKDFWTENFRQYY